MTAEIEVYGADWCGDCRRTERLLKELNVSYTKHDVEKSDELRDKAISICGKQSIPVVVFPDGEYFVEPSDPQMRDKLAELGII
ncbi:MAG: NrdH-redoxin [Actinobacteria bacterium]|nr:NrdH-redoxin [Actinomycetota bacterium]